MCDNNKVPQDFKTTFWAVMGSLLMLLPSLVKMLIQALRRRLLKRKAKKAPKKKED